MQFFSRLFTLLPTLIFLNACTAPVTSTTIMTYNIRHGVGLDRVLDLERTADVIRSINPDIVILNEVDNGTSRAFGVHQADSLGKLLQLTAHFGRSIDYDGGEYGNALLSNFPLLSFDIVDLSVDTLAEGRSVFLASLDLGSDTLVIMGTHLGLQPTERQSQIYRILEHLPQTKQLILAGDFNLEPTEANYRLLADSLIDGVLVLNPQPDLTFPADEPVRRIDYIFLGSGITPLTLPEISSSKLASASDHRPQVLTFQYK